jgi:hypothetical protein
MSLRKFCLRFMLLAFLPGLPALAQCNYSESLSVTNVSANIVVNNRVSSVIVRENPTAGSAPSAYFSITPAASGAVAVNMQVGNEYQFSNGTGQYASGTVLGTIVATTAGPFTFVLCESNAAVAARQGGGSTTSGGSSSITSPVDGSGNVKVNCETGCAGGNPNGQATMANSAPVTIASNQSNLPGNEAQINGVAPLMNNGVSGTGSQRVNLASDNSALGAWGHGATGSAVPAGATQVAGKNGSGNLQALSTDASGNVGVNVQNTTAQTTNTITSTQTVAVLGDRLSSEIIRGTWLRVEYCAHIDRDAECDRQARCQWRNRRKHNDSQYGCAGLFDLRRRSVWPERWIGVGRQRRAGFVR